jgi:hypothetical protein
VKQWLAVQNKKLADLNKDSGPGAGALKGKAKKQVQLDARSHCCWAVTHGRKYMAAGAPGNVLMCHSMWITLDYVSLLCAPGADREQHEDGDWAVVRYNEAAASCARECGIPVVLRGPLGSLCLQQRLPADAIQAHPCTRR